MIDFSKRTNQSEIMDDLKGGGEDLIQALRELETINTWLGGHKITLSGIKKILAKHPEKKDWKIMDIGCGRGDSLIRIAKWGRRKKLNLQLLGLDANPHIVLEARGHCRNYKEIKFRVLDVFDPLFPKLKTDICCCTLFTHHFEDEQLQYLLKSFHTMSGFGWVINDLHRHPLAFYSIKWLTQLFSQSDMVKNDAPLSVMRSFSKEELESLLNQIYIDNYSIEWKWAFRWELVVFKPLKTST
jgi:SAM-dependent methyltransferase